MKYTYMKFTYRNTFSIIMLSILGTAFCSGMQQSNGYNPAVHGQGSSNVSGGNPSPAQNPQQPQGVKKEEQAQSVKKENDRCAVCRHKYKADALKIGLECNHYFHLGCILPWASQEQANGTTPCPTCRAPIKIYDPIEYDEQEKIRLVGLNRELKVYTNKDGEQIDEPADIKKLRGLTNVKISDLKRPSRPVPQDRPVEPTRVIPDLPDNIMTREEWEANRQEYIRRGEGDIGEYRGNRQAEQPQPRAFGNALGNNGFIIQEVPGAYDWEQPHQDPRWRAIPILQPAPNRPHLPAPGGNQGNIPILPNPPVPLPPQPVPNPPAPGGNNGENGGKNNAPAMPSLFRKIGSEALAGFMMGLVMSGEFGPKKDKNQRESLNMRRIGLYAPTAFCAYAVAKKANPQRTWGFQSIASWAVGMIAGMLLPNIGRRTAPAQSSQS